MAGLPTTKVHQTAVQRNYVFATMVDVPAPTADDTVARASIAAPKLQYKIFFTIRRPDQKAGHDLRLFVESAYAPGDAPPCLPRRPSTIRFAALATKIFRRQPVTFAAR